MHYCIYTECEYTATIRIHLQVEGTDFIIGKRHETGCSDIHLVIFGLSQRHLQHHHAHTLLTQTQVIQLIIILYALMTLLASKYLVSITILVSLYHLPENQPQL